MIETALRQRLLDDSDVYALVADRIYGGAIASLLVQSPFVTFELAGSPMDYSHDGEMDATIKATFLVTAWSDDYLESIALAQAIRQALPVGGFEPSGSDEDVTVNTCFIRDRKDVAFQDLDNERTHYGRQLTVELTYSEE